MENAKPIPEFPEYLIDPEGTIYTARNGMVRRPSRTRRGAMKITLYDRGVPHTRSLAPLVAQTHLYNDFDPEIFDTPIHLDNDATNNHVNNLAWRPRWFAVKYHQQYWREEFRYAAPRIQEELTGDVYNSFIEPCQRFGILYMDIIKSCTKGNENVFPTNKSFRFL